MKKILSLVLTLAMIMSFAFFASPAAFADNDSATSFSVEKNPTAETIKAGGKAIFMAYPKGEKNYTVYWTLEDDSGHITEAENAPDKFPGLIVEFPDRQRIRLKNVPESMNGLKVKAHFANPDGETIHSEYALLSVEPNPCTNSSNASGQTASKVIITKHPWDEIKLRDGQASTYFEAHATNYSWVSWEFKIGDHGETFSAEKAASDYGLCLEGMNSEKLWIHGISWGINGWYVRAVFYDCNGNPTYSKWAFMRLVEYVEPCKPCNPCNPCTPPPPCNTWVQDPYLGSPGAPVYGWSQTVAVTTAHVETDATTVSVYGTPIAFYP